jgi:hypothetical protein
MHGDRDAGETQRALQQAARDRILTERVDRLELEVARVNAHLDGASVTLLPSAGAIRPPVGPDPGSALQRIVQRRTDPPEPSR